ncbi:MAG: lytic transglycosylase domain-containing protein [Terracidiphilus sp.]
MHTRLQSAAALAALLVGCASRPAQSAERVSLTNGYDIVCSHHAQVGSHIRLYMGPGVNSYIDRAPSDIAKIEAIPDPPPPPADPASVNPQTEAPLSSLDLHEMLARASQQHNLDADLLASVVKAESDGNPRAVSRAGARGLMQLMPKTAAEVGVDDSFRPDQNVRGGSAYLNELLVKYHDNIALALAAYNAGPAAVDKYHGIPPYHETRAYVARVIHEFNRRVLARQAHFSQARQATQSPFRPSTTR